LFSDGGRRLAESQAVLIASPEYGFSLPGAPFHVTGSATDGEGRAVAAATVSLQLISGPRLTTVSDAVGFYEFSLETYRNAHGYVGGVTGAREGHESDTRGLGNSVDG
jgi:hypothetical protein